MAVPSTEGYSEVWLEYEKLLGQRPIFKGSVEEIIEQSKGLEAKIQAQSPPPDASVHTRDEPANGVPVRIYTPPAAETDKKLPVGLYYHGGGYMIGSLDTEDPSCRYVAKHTPCIIVSVDYRLSPKYKQPAMIDDCLAVFKWAHNAALTLGGDPSKFFTIGGSAGGGLALTVVDQLIKEGKRSQVQGVVAMVPVTAHPNSLPDKYKLHYKSHVENGSGVPIIDASSVKTFFDSAGVDYHDEKTFVTLSENLKEFPPTYVAMCGKDPLRDDGVVLLSMLKDARVKTKEDHYDGFPHYWWLMPGIPGAEQFLEKLVKGVQWALSQ